MRRVRALGDEHVLLVGAYAVAAVVYASGGGIVGYVVVAVAYASGGLQQWRERRDRACYGQHAACRTRGR